MEAPDPVFSFRGEMGNVLCILLSAKSGQELLYAGTSQGFVHLWILKVKRELKKIHVSETSCSSIVEIPKGFATLGKGEAVKLWNSEWTLSKIIPTEFCGFCNILFYGALLVPGCDGRILLMNLEGEVQSVMVHESSKKHGEVMCMKYSTSLDVIVSCFESGLVVVWKKDGVPICDTEVEDTPMCLDICENFSKILVGTSGMFLHKLSFKNGALTVESKTELTNPGISGVSIRSDGKLCAVSCWDNKVRYFSVKTLKLLAVLDNRTVPNCIEFSDKTSFSEPGFVFVGGSDGRITIWDLYANK
uniref:Guanine nucleotide-binding protein subunit beta-like protein 1 n=1 Tax=Lygus hesperus TaxID=30085 RepID=A0A0A9Y053_LYGHE